MPGLIVPDSYYQWLKVRLDHWGFILPPDASRWKDLPGHDVNDVFDEAFPHLDFGWLLENDKEVIRPIRRMWIQQIGIVDNWTSGQTSGIHGGFITRVSGVDPIEDYDLTTKRYVDSHAGRNSLSGLIDVSGVWFSGAFVSWNGSYFVPAFASTSGGGGGGSCGHFEQEFTATSTIVITHSLGQFPQVTVLDSGLNEISVEVDEESVDSVRLTFNGSITSGLAILDTGTCGATSGCNCSFSGLSDTEDVWASGDWVSFDGTDFGPGPFLPQPSGNYSLVGHNHDDRYYTKTETDQQFAASGFHYQAGSGLISTGENYHVQTGSGLYLQDDLVGFDAAGFGDVRYLLSGLYQPSGAYALQATQIIAGSGLIGGGDLSTSRTIHVQVGSGLYLQNDLVGFDQAGYGDVRYALSGSGGSSTHSLTDPAVHTDVSGTYVSGSILIFNGTKWIPGTTSSSTPTSGQINVEVELSAGAITGTSVSISGFDQTYDDLRLEIVGRTNFVGSSEILGIYFNGDSTGANYRYAINEQGTGGPNTRTGSSFWLSIFADSDEGAGQVSQLEVKIQRYTSTAINKVAVCDGFTWVDTNRARVNSQVEWVVTPVAINMITLASLNGGTFQSEATYRLLATKKMWVLSA